MRRETGARLRSAMADNGVDALILLMNDNVVYATRRQLAGAGRRLVAC